MSRQDRNKVADSLFSPAIAVATHWVFIAVILGVLLLAYLGWRACWCRAQRVSSGREPAGRCWLFSFIWACVAWTRKSRCWHPTPPPPPPPPVRSPEEGIHVVIEEEEEEEEEEETASCCGFQRVPPPPSSPPRPSIEEQRRRRRRRRRQQQDHLPNRVAGPHHDSLLQEYRDRGPSPPSLMEIAIISPASPAVLNIS